VARKEGDNLVLDVVNRGIGISSEELPHLFEKFYRTEAAREAGIKGTGLGLVLVKEAVQAHGGTIEVESELGVGTRFTVTLPVDGKRG
jgi:signal transduction histidine kinase